MHSNDGTSIQNLNLEPLLRLSHRLEATDGMQPQVFFTCHPRYIHEKSLKLAESLLVESGQKLKVPCRTVEGVASSIYTAALAELPFSRTAALIARSIAAEIFWIDEQLSAMFQEELADLATSNFITTWMNEFSRGCNHEGRLCPTLDDLASQLDDVRFNRSNPRLEESAFEDLYLEELHIAECEDSSLMSACTVPTARAQVRSTEPDCTPTQTTITLPLAEKAGSEETLRAASILLGDLYSMGLIHPDVMQMCTLYIVDNLCLASDVRCLHVLLNRAATYLAPSLGLVFLRTCHRKIMLGGSAMLKEDTSELLDLLTLVDDIITHDAEFSKTDNVACYARRACHRWDSSLDGDRILR
ncbi:hypothetical protein LshimejAT787_0605610 [Lyophyllum shimeji]|uniref:Uncharacterized protein n=1 Tax=Lyophyllum shimeji TaxID=47721 RepID=A0A9P3ULL1_LYOSH|nr:hypothetical protein LshimejAT787_0605610 [Lyophyllum shimeji]